MAGSSADCRLLVRQVLILMVSRHLIRIQVLILMVGERAGAPLRAAANGAREHALLLAITTCYYYLRPAAYSLLPSSCHPLQARPSIASLCQSCCLC